ncbi:hypothetical protein KKG46_04715 [Patescibacteria group bacterium]|nr:hypothetical protein [Patescibacteria group bacterium]
MSLKVIALGTGVCTNGCTPGADRQPPGFLFDYNGNLLLIDASEGIRFRINEAGYDYGKVAHLALSHVHPDHCALPQFLQAKLCRVLWGGATDGMEKIKIFMHEGSAEGFTQVWNWHHPEAGGKLNHFPDKFNFEIQAIRGGWSEEIFPGFTIKAFGVYHGFGQHPALGFRIECQDGVVVYTGDAGITDSLFDQITSADLLIADCGVRIGQEYTAGYGHMGPSQVGMLAMRGQVKELWLTHYTGLDSPEAMIHEVRNAGYSSGECKVATDKLIWSK